MNFAELSPLPVFKSDPIPNLFIYTTLSAMPRFVKSKNVPQSLGHRMIGIDVHAKDFEFNPYRLPRNFDILQYLESQAAKGPRGERWDAQLVVNYCDWDEFRIYGTFYISHVRIPGNVHDASVSAEKEIRRRWIALGSGFEDDFTTAKSLQRRIERIDERFVALRRDISSKKGKVKTLQSFKDYLSQVFFPFNLNPLSSQTPKHSQRMSRYHQFRGDEMDVNINPNILHVPDFSDLMSSSEDSSSWLYPDQETVDAEPQSEEIVADVEGENDENVIGYGCEPSLENDEPSLENTEPPLSFDKSTQANRCPCPPLTLLWSEK